MEIKGVDFFELSLLVCHQPAAKGVTHTASVPTNLKKKVALFACRDTCGSKTSTGGWEAFWARRVGVALSCLMSYPWISRTASKPGVGEVRRHFFERLIVDKACGILGDVQLTFLKVLPKLPMPCQVNGLLRASRETHRMTPLVTAICRRARWNITYMLRGC